MNDIGKIDDIPAPNFTPKNNYKIGGCGLRNLV